MNTGIFYANQPRAWFMHSPINNAQGYFRKKNAEAVCPCHRGGRPSGKPRCRVGNRSWSSCEHGVQACLRVCLCVCAGALPVHGWTRVRECACVCARECMYLCVPHTFG